MKYVSKYMQFVKMKEEYRLSGMFQFFLMFYGFFLFLIALYKFILTYKLDQTVLQLGVVGFLLFFSGFSWRFIMTHKDDYKKINEDRRKFYADITS